MKSRLRSPLLAFTLAILSTASFAATDAELPNAPEPPTWPTPLEVVVPFEPTPFQSGGRTHLVYEVYLRNFGSDAVAVRRVEVFDADVRGTDPLAVFAGEQLGTLVQPIAYTPTPDGADKTRLSPGASVVVFMWIALDHSAKIPSHLRHRVVTADNALNGPAIGTRTVLRVLGPPVTGMHWLGADAPSNDPENHHRRGVLVMDGRAAISRRFAVDWKQALRFRATRSTSARTTPTVSRCGR